MMQKCIFLLLIVATSCHQKNKLAGTWQLLKKSNDHQVIFQFDAHVNSKKYIYWFKDDSTLITQDDDGGNRQLNRYVLSNDKITLFDRMHANTFFFKIADGKLSLKSIYSPFNMELKRLN